MNTPLIPSNSRLVYSTSTRAGYTPRYLAPVVNPLTAFQTEVVKANVKRSRLSTFLKTLSD